MVGADTEVITTVYLVFAGIPAPTREQARHILLSKCTGSLVIRKVGQDAAPLRE